MFANNVLVLVPVQGHSRLHLQMRLGKQAQAPRLCLPAQPFGMSC